MSKQMSSPKFISIIPPGFGVIIGVIVPFTFYYFLVDGAVIDEFKIVFSFSRFFVPIIYGIFSLTIAYMTFRSISSTSVYLGVFAIVDYFSKGMFFEGGATDKNAIIILLIMVFLLIFLILIYNFIIRENYHSYVIGQTNAFKIKFNISIVNDEYIRKIIFIVRTPDLWGLFDDREKMLKKMLVNCFYKHYRDRTNSDINSVIKSIEELNFLIPDTQRFFYALGLAFITTLILICNGITFIQNGI